MCLLAMCIASLKEYLIKVFAHFSMRSFCCCWVVLTLYVFLILTTYQIYNLQIFSTIPQVTFITLLIVSVALQLFIWCNSIWIFCCLCFWCCIQEINVLSNVRNLSLLLSSKSWIFSGTTFRSLIPLELIFVYGVK